MQVSLRLSEVNCALSFCASRAFVCWKEVGAACVGTSSEIATASSVEANVSVTMSVIVANVVTRQIDC